MDIGHISMGKSAVEYLANFPASIHQTWAILSQTFGQKFSNNLKGAQV
jgi:hypothetical protein